MPHLACADTWSSQEELDGCVFSEFGQAIAGKEKASEWWEAPFTPSFQGHPKVLVPLGMELVGNPMAVLVACSPVLEPVLCIL